MRRFIDLHLKPLNKALTKRMLSRAKDMGYSEVAIAKKTLSIPLDNNLEGIDIIQRVNIEPKRREDLLKKLKIRNRAEIISVKCNTKKVSLQAAKDHRVDILNFSTDPNVRRNIGFDRSIASLAKSSSCAYEINMTDLLKSPKPLLNLITILRKEIELANKNKIPLILSSGATNLYEMREPRALISLLDILNIGEEKGLEMVSTNPWKLVEKNRKKLSNSFVQPGVWRV
jgi:ribonuclease P/MRP protein subunit RPP1